MCGIVCGIAKHDIVPDLLEGLRRLEYRGYDSAGIALVDERGDLFVEKRAGKLANLQTAISCHAVGGCGWRRRACRRRAGRCALGWAFEKAAKADTGQPVLQDMVRQPGQQRFARKSWFGH